MFCICSIAQFKQDGYVEMDEDCFEFDAAGDLKNLQQ